MSKLMKDIFHLLLFCHAFSYKEQQLRYNNIKIWEPMGSLDLTFLSSALFDKTGKASSTDESRAGARAF
jgi:hypothetical protein